MVAYDSRKYANNLNSLFIHLLKYRTAIKIEKEWNNIEKHFMYCEEKKEERKFYVSRITLM